MYMSILKAREEATATYSSKSSITIERNGRTRKRDRLERIKRRVEEGGRMMHRKEGGGGDFVSLCEVHGRLLSGTAGSMLRRDSGEKREGTTALSFPRVCVCVCVPPILFFRSGQER